MNLTDILISFDKDEVLGVGGKGLSIFDGDDDFYLLNKNNSNIISSSPVFRSDLVVWGYRDPAMSSLFLHVIQLI